MQKIQPFLWFSDTAEEAATFYTSVFPDSHIEETTRYTEAGTEVHGQEPGSVMTVAFELDGYSFVALNGGPQFTINPSISFFVNCGSAEEVDAFWAELSEGGQALMPLDEYPFSKRYGWVQDRFGVSWQIILAEQTPRSRFIPSLLFVGDQCGRAEEAITLYTSVFDGGKKLSLFPYGPDHPHEREGNVMYADFEIENQLFVAMDSGLDHDFGFNEAVSFAVNCADQAEVDRYWEALSAVPDAEQCGWLKDRFGVSWQIVPTELSELLGTGDADRGKRITEALLQMKKIDVQALRQAAQG